MNNENSNVGNQLKKLAGIIATIILFAGIIIGGSFQDNIVFILVVILISAVCAYLSSIMLYAFGVLVESAVSIDQKLDDITNKSESMDVSEF